MSFDPKKHIIRVQGNREYLPVSARLVWFRQEHPDWSIVTSPIEINLEKQYAIFSASIMNAEGKIIATGTKMENVKGFPDYLEKSETGAVGRALAMTGFGTQFAPELEESDRFADAPIGSPMPVRTPVRPSGMNGRPGPLRGPLSSRTNGDSGRANTAPPNEPLPAPNDAPEAIADHAKPSAAVARPAAPAAGNASAGLTRIREPEPEYVDPGGEDEPDSPDEPFDELPLAAPAFTPARSAAPETVAPPAPPKPNPLAGNNCSVSGCPNVLTPSQMTMTKQKYGRPLCLLHQRDPALTGVGRAE